VIPARRLPPFDGTDPVTPPIRGCQLRGISQGFTFHDVIITLRQDAA